VLSKLVLRCLLASITLELSIPSIDSCLLMYFIYVSINLPPSVDILMLSKRTDVKYYIPKNSYNTQYEKFSESNSDVI
jgi:hypothetical protein